MTDATPTRELLEHASFVRALARAILRDEHAARDIEQETWRSALERPPRSGDLRGWLATVARNAARRRRRSEARRGERERRAARLEALPAADAVVGREEVLERVVRAVLALDEPYRSTVFERYYEGRSPRAIASRHGLSVETVRTRQKRALARLRAELEGDARDWRPALVAIAGTPAAAGAAVGAVAKAALATLLLAGAVGGVAAWRAAARDAGASAPPTPELAAASAVDRSELAAIAAEDSSEPAAIAAPAEDEALRRAVVVAPERGAAAVVSGRVLDATGEPVADAEVYVLGDADPFGREHAAPEIGWNRWQGRTFRTGANGRWSAELPTAMRVLVALGTARSWERVTEPNERWVDAPADGLDWVVARVGTATLRVRVDEGAARRPVSGFRVVVRGDPDHRPEPGEPATYTGGYFQRGTHGEVLSFELAVPDRGGRRLLVTLLPPLRGGPWENLAGGEPPPLEQELRLFAGELRELVFTLPDRDRLRGTVVDATGTPVADALVFFGTEIRVRGDEPFEPIREKRILDGARTGPDGWFELAGEGMEVTAVHADHSPATVPIERAGRIELGPRGTIRGTLRGSDGLPLFGASLRLDDERGPLATTDAAGRFAFDRVEAGAHAVWLEDGELLAGVRLGVGEEVDLALRRDAGEELVLECGRPPMLELDGLRGGIVGLERVFGIYEIGPSAGDGAFLVRARVVPGRYWLVTDVGLVGSLTVEEGAVGAGVQVGRARLVVRAERAASVQLVPTDADAFLRLAAARVRVGIDAGGEAVFRVEPGDYLVVGEAGRVLAEVLVPPEGSRIELE